MKKTTTKTEKIPTFAELRIMMNELRESQKETDRMMKENAISMQETDRKMQETDRKMGRIFEEIGGISNSNGMFAEEYFQQAFEKDGDKTFAGMHFDAMTVNLNVADPKIKREDEYDIVLYNDESIAIIETKYRGRQRNIKDVINKADSFRFWFPRYKNHKVYLGLASLAFEKDTILKAKEKGIAIIRQRGGKSIVNDENLIAY
jgi:hypothetical protein